MTPAARSFEKWETSDENPLRNASERVKFFTWPALRAAFMAGRRSTDENENIFEEESET